MSTKKGEHQIVDHAEIVEGGRQLERSHQTPGDPLLGRHVGDVFAFIADRSLVGRVISRQQIEERGLTGAVRPDDAGDLILAQQVIDVIDGNQCAEPFGNTFSTDDLGARVRVHVRPFSDFPPRRMQETCVGAEIDGVRPTGDG